MDGHTWFMSSLNDTHVGHRSESLHFPSRDPTVGFSASGAATDPTVDRTPTPSHGPANFHVSRLYCPGSRTCATRTTTATTRGTHRRSVRRMARARGICTAGEMGGVASGGWFGAWVEKVLESSMGESGWDGVWRGWCMRLCIEMGWGRWGEEERESIVG
ncbi:hypothetical protein AMTR_s00135p00090600 [Amborella trichopoda]|uniref:Uncharacterized protein n=1 Tax=Amborella trichopoda TaxID=13333 RepID=W1P5N9_AMBTC|nr:hypothetical protein AMTR_s00135p00090600 [Amborella trichopoda]